MCIDRINYTAYDVFAYTDDTTLLVSDPDCMEIFNNRTWSVETIDKWLEANHLVLSDSKCKSLLFKTYQYDQDSETVGFRLCQFSFFLVFS